MAEPPEDVSGSLTQRLDLERLLEWMREQRWFASKSQSLVAVEIIEEAALDDELLLAVAQVQFATGGHELYQILLAHNGDEVTSDALADPTNARRLLEAIDQAREINGAHGCFCFRHVGDGSHIDPALAAGPVRAMGAEQSNSSVVFDEQLVLKLFRRLESGINPELEMLRFLTARDYPNIAPLYGWYEYEGETLAATLAIAQRFVPGGTDGWDLALAEIPADTDGFLQKLATLGTATARLHSVLATDAGDPAFSPEEPSAESVSLLKATLDEELERMFARLPDDPRVAPIAGLEQEVRELIRLPSTTAIGGRNIRIHGDFHLGQTLYTEDGWTLLDFEGEPARPLTVRRAKRSPLRDIASMLRSFSYASWAVELQLGQPAPAGFEEQAREVFLSSYFDRVEPTLLPTGEAQVQGLLAIFELEKALYELQYELDNRPDWVPIPVAGIARLVESG
jgi:maltokinase